MPADIDWGQVIFLILVVVVGFIRWLGNLIQQQKEAKERAQLSPEERALREAAWRRQIGQDEPAPESNDPFRELKDLLEQFQPKPATPPPVPPPQAPRLRPAVRPGPPPPLPVPVPVATAPQPVAAAAFPTSSTVQRVFTEAREAGMASVKKPSAQLKGLRLELASPRALRQAILVREVLGPPVALRGEGP